MEPNRKIDAYSFALGVCAAFCEVVRAGVKRIALTDRGRLANETHRAFHEEMVRQVLSELSEEDARVFMRGLESVSRFFANKK